MLINSSVYIRGVYRLLGCRLEPQCDKIFLSWNRVQHRIWCPVLSSFASIAVRILNVSRRLTRNDPSECHGIGWSSMSFHYRALSSISNVILEKCLSIIYYKLKHFLMMAKLMLCCIGINNFLMEGTSCLLLPKVHLSPLVGYFKGW